MVCSCSYVVVSLFSMDDDDSIIYQNCGLLAQYHTSQLSSAHSNSAAGGQQKELGAHILVLSYHYHGEKTTTSYYGM